MKEYTITITEKEYFELRKDSLKLNLLDAAGVDNWDHYGDALNPEGEPDFMEQVDALQQEISDLNAESKTVQLTE